MSGLKIEVGKAYRSTKGRLVTISTRRVFDTLYGRPGPHVVYGGDNHCQYNGDGTEHLRYLTQKEGYTDPMMSTADPLVSEIPTVTATITIT